MTEQPVIGLHEILQNHIKDCGKCQDAIRTPTQAFGGKSRMCSSYTGLIQEYADYEGKVNNFVDPHNL